MNHDDLFVDATEKKVYLALQKAGQVLPCDIEEDDESGEYDELPEALKDTDSAVARIMSGGEPVSRNMIHFNTDTTKRDPAGSEWALAARHGVKLSDASRDKIRKLRESNGELQ